MKPGAKFLASELIITIGLLGSIPFIATDAAKAAQAGQENFTITILHSNDLHAHEDSFDERGRTVGGISRIAHLIKTTKKNGKNVLAIDAGDIFQGTPFFETYKGETEIESLNKAGYDIYTIGNHEFDEGSKNLGEKLKAAKFDVISANLDASAVPDLAAVVKPSVVKTIDGQKVAFIGMITPVLNEMAPRLDGVKVKAIGQQWLEPLKEEVAKMRKQGINKIVVVSHCGVEQEKEMAENIPEIDVVVGGHSHTRLDKPVVVKHADGSTAFVVQTGCYGRALGRLDLTFDGAGNLVVPQSKYRLINITDKVFQDPELQAYLDEKSKPFAALSKTYIAMANGNFDNKFKFHPWDSPIGDLICDALVDSGAEYGATMALQNRGGIRGPLEQGQVSIQRVREILPFTNKLMVATMKGDALLQVLEKSVSGMLGARFLDVAGLKFAYEPTKEVGKRVAFAFAQNKEGQWERVVPNELYRVGVNDFTFTGGEGYDFKDPKDIVDTKLRLSTTMEKYLEKKKQVTPEPPSRIIPVSSNIAKLDGAGKSKSIMVDYPAPGAELSIVTGSGQGVSFMKKVGIVPMMNPSLYQQTKLDDAGQLKIDMSPIAAKSKGETWVSVVLKARDKDGHTTRIASIPFKVE